MAFYRAIYVARVEELNPELIQKALDRLDGDRRRRLEQGVRNRAWEERLVAGVLLDRAVRDWRKMGECALQGQMVRADLGLQEISIREELGKKCKPLDLHFTYGSWGKPYLDDQDMFFSLSHSQGMVLCVASHREVGADLQFPRKTSMKGIVERYFTPEERKVWETLGEEEKEDWFFERWTAKEAYGKCTGEGIGRTIGRSPGEDFSWEQGRLEEAYLSICYREVRMERE